MKEIIKKWQKILTEAKKDLDKTDKEKQKLCEKRNKSKYEIEEIKQATYDIIKLETECNTIEIMLLDIITKINN